MKKPNKKQLIDLIKYHSNDKQKVANDLKVSLRTLYYYIEEYNIDINSLFVDDKLKIEKLNFQLEKEKKLNKSILKELSSKESELDSIFSIKNSIDFKGLSKENFGLQKYKESDKSSIATLFFSDEHWGEVVKSNQVNGLNEYNHKIAQERYKKVIENSLNIMFSSLNCVNKDFLVVNLGGDNISGSIHEELALTNDLTEMEAVVDYVEHKVKGLNELLKAGFKEILINCVSGNHDRGTDKTHTKNRNETSFSYIVYKMLQMAFSNEKRIKFNIATGSDCIYTVANTTMLLTHGDQFKGGNGIAGPGMAIYRGFLKKKSSLATNNIYINSMCIGHFHNWSDVNGEVIINGTLKGYDEYSQKMNFPYQDPCQGFWLTHPERGISIKLPIYTK